MIISQFIKELDDFGSLSFPGLIDITWLYEYTVNSICLGQFLCVYISTIQFTICLCSPV